MALEQRDFYFFYISITFNMEIRRCCVLFCVPRRVKLPLSEIALQIEIEIDVHFKSRSNLSKYLAKHSYEGGRMSRARISIALQIEIENDVHFKSIS